MNRREMFFTIDKIVTRAEQLGISMGNRITHFMDVELATEQFNLDVESWLKADDENFIHDYIGIYNNVDRVNKNFGYFVPRFARQ